jgi:hypothetical protein
MLMHTDGFVTWDRRDTSCEGTIVDAIIAKIICNYIIIF